MTVICEENVVIYCSVRHLTECCSACSSRCSMDHLGLWDHVGGQHIFCNKKSTKTRISSSQWLKLICGVERCAGSRLEQLTDATRRGTGCTSTSTIQSIIDHFWCFFIVRNYPTSVARMACDSIISPCIAVYVYVRGYIIIST